MIVTNAHVVDGATTITVVLADGSRHDADVVASDPRGDLALLRVLVTGLPVAALRAELPQVGETVIAVGNPLGFENSVTAGIVSGLQRTIPPELTPGAVLVDLIQTDAALSPGNSGGALVTTDGRIAGVLVAYVPPQIGAVSLGFAIPSPTVARTVEQLLTEGEVRHPWLGVQALPLTAQVADRFGLDVDEGVLVIGVEADSPARAAGLVEGDVVRAMAGEPVRDLGDFLRVLGRQRPGDELAMDVVRASEELTVPVVVGERPAG